jgi:hypothetical protein
LSAGNNEESLLYLSSEIWWEIRFFSWNWTASQGHSGGTLIWVRHGDLDAVKMDEGRCFSSVKIRNTEGDFCWKIINVYGPVKHGLKG